MRHDQRRSVERRICRTALDLFAERGFDRVTVAEIAAAADVGERSVYRYFGTKEGIVLGTAPGTFHRFLLGLERTPQELPLVDAYRRVLARAMANEDDLDLDRDRMALLRRTPSLRTAWFAELLGFEDGLALWISARTGGAADGIEVRAAAAAFVAAHRLASERWDGESMASFGADFDRAMGVLRPQLPSSSIEPPR